MTIAIFHLSIKIISRANAKSAVAAAAYRAAEKITNDYDGIIHDYTRKSGIIHTEILLPEHAPKEFQDRSTLWNAVEKIEKNKKAQLAREIEIALPKELSREENIQLAREYVRKKFVNEGMCADICFHDKGDGNPHCHIMLTMRPFKDNGEWDDKQRKEYILNSNGEKIYDKKKRTYKCRSVPTTDWNNRANSEEWREAWADEVNAFLLQKKVEQERRRGGLCPSAVRLTEDERIDHRSYERQGVEQIPTIHLGTAVCQMERNGIKTEKGDINRQIKEDNLLIKAIKNGISLFKKKLAEAFSRKAEIEKEIAELPRSENLIAKLMRFHENGYQFNQTAAPYLRNIKNVRGLKNVATALAFLENNNISTIEDLTVKLYECKTKHAELNSAINSKQSRVKELKTLLENYQIYKAQNPVLEQYEGIKSEKKRAEFYSRYNCEIINCKRVRKLLPEKLTPKAWTKQRDELTAELTSDRSRLSLFEDKIAQMETIIKNIESLDRYERGQERERSKQNNYELE